MPHNNVTIRQVEFNREQAAIESIRRKVFIEEQDVPEELEWDGLDTDAVQLLATNSEDKPVATARMLSNGHIGRMAVLPQWRGQGIGHALLSALLDIARQRQLPGVYLNAQLSAVGFYAKAGFQTEGDTFMDAGIPHKRMFLQLDRID
jgi:predicted GNAT family N-acyltransferase